MSTLQQSVNQRRAAEFPVLTSVAIDGQTPGVVVSIWEGESWMFPWSYLVAARLNGSTGDETLVLTFTSHVVTAKGRNLRQVMVDLAHFRVIGLSNFPVLYEAQFPHDAAFIGGLDVVASGPSSLTSAGS